MGFNRWIVIFQFTKLARDLRVPASLEKARATTAAVVSVGGDATLEGAASPTAPGEEEEEEGLL